MLQIRAMTVEDVPLAMRLKEQSGWNQTEADWLRFLALEPAGCFVAEWNGQFAGTTTTCRFGAVASIAAVLVDIALRGRGIGTRLVEHALTYLEAQGVPTMRLDATPLGKPIYEKLGFSLQYELARFTGTAMGGNASVPRVQPVLEEQLDAIGQLDRQTTGADRRRLIERLFHQEPGRMRAFMGPEYPLGYATLRRGSQATQIGPVVAMTSEAGLALLEAALHDCQGIPIYVDIPLNNAPAMRWAEAKGLTVQRRLARMCRGKPVIDQIPLLWASSGPEHG
jgi:predicted N-acetyltransferase YhbS